MVAVAEELWPLWAEAPDTVTNARNSISKNWTASEAEGIRRDPRLLVGLDKMSNALLTC